ncbi:hypothetical protein ACO34A_15330 [Rhizobium sp. ACO-34A]|nr:hypothetical protein ACO34A_15330 [Rhizobium sp. ACO-34A]
MLSSRRIPLWPAGHLPHKGGETWRKSLVHIQRDANKQLSQIKTWAGAASRTTSRLEGGEERSAQRSNRSSESIAATNAGKAEGGALA